MQRYQPVVSEWNSFLAAAGRPEPVSLRVNTLRASPETLRTALESRGFRFEPIPGLPAFLRVLEEPFPISLTLEHWLGHFYLQQAVTGVAPLALGAQPGERILDLCAAPGGKTSHLAELLEGRGIVVAGEKSEGRIRGLLGNLYRMNHTGVLVVAADGRTFPSGVLFDRVLVDAPCSGEGNLRRRGKAPSAEGSSASFREYLTGVQRSLLRRAVELVKPGGVVLYVTCTFAPEENEAIIARALARLPVTLEPIPLNIPHETGLTQFEGRDFTSDMEHAWRLYPQHLDSGGLFMARLRRTDGDVPPDDEVRHRGWTEVPAGFAERAGSPTPAEVGHAPTDRIAEGLARLREEMCVTPEALAGGRWMLRGDSVWLHSCAEWPVDAWEAEHEANFRSDWRLVSTGLRAFRYESSGRLRATNDMLRWLDRHIGERNVDLTGSECLRLLEAGDVAVDGVSNGAAALRLEGHVIGRGWVRSGRLRSEIPRARAHGLKDVLRVSGVQSHSSA